MDSYINCNDCQKPLVNEQNVQIFRKRMWFYLGSGTVIGGIVSAFTLPLIGFGALGVGAGSLAAAWQASIGNVVAGSTFAVLQSLGATKLGILLFGAMGSATCPGAMEIVRRNVSYFNWCECQSDEAYSANSQNCEAKK